MDKTTEIEAAVFRKLLAHLDQHKEVQNIDLMILADFCRNCLAKWYSASAADLDGHRATVDDVSWVDLDGTTDGWLAADALEVVPVESRAPSEDDVVVMMYTSGTTGKPKGVVHTTGGYNLYTHTTFKWTFDIKEDDVYWCTADVGWITGHSYIVYGPLSNGAPV